MTKLLFVGGFLGAGKTTLMFELTRILKDQGKIAGLITNDQAPDLADTSLLGHIDVKLAEVTGSCFCCDFKGLRRAIAKIGADTKTDVIIAEPLGSCTDLSATLIHPIQDIMKKEVTVCPLTVLIDPARLKTILDGGSDNLHPSAAYIIRKQLEESDIIAITKTDLYSADEIVRLSAALKQNYPDCDIRAISAKTGEGVPEWYREVLSRTDAGKHIPEVDYDIYAEGEAVLGWLNCAATLSGKAVDWDAFTRRLMQELARTFDVRNAAVGHVKMILENGDEYTAANLTGRSDTLVYRWSAGKSDSAELIVNARVEMAPELLQRIFLEALERASRDIIKFHINRIRSISPAYPRPTHRYKKN
jgi:Ni2+-binding GTPase involved in maturation of urease and hydrogenase